MSKECWMYMATTTGAILVALWKAGSGIWSDQRFRNIYYTGLFGETRMVLELT